MEAFQRRVSEALAQSGGTGPDLAAQAAREMSRPGCTSCNRSAIIKKYQRLAGPNRIANGRGL